MQCSTCCFLLKISLSSVPKCCEVYTVEPLLMTTPNVGTPSLFENTAISSKGAFLVQIHQGRLSIKTKISFPNGVHYRGVLL